jgi:hypothetical protein
MVSISTILLKDACDKKSIEHWVMFSNLIVVLSDPRGSLASLPRNKVRILTRKVTREWHEGGIEHSNASGQSPEQQALKPGMVREESR